MTQESQVKEITFFKTINDHTRTTYFVLPLVYLNKFSFGPQGNFVNAYVTEDGMRIVAEVVNPRLVYSGIWLNQYFLEEKDGVFQFELPQIYRKDVLLLMEGKYSRITEKTKEMIRTHSGLNWRKVRIDTDGTAVHDTDARLMALDKHEALRDKLNDILGLYERGRNEPISEDSELLSPPHRDREVWELVLQKREDTTTWVALATEQQ